MQEYKSGKSDKSSKKSCNPGVHCDVSNCIYNDQSSKCYADKIDVGPTHAEDSSDTVCATFKQES